MTMQASIIAKGRLLRATDNLLRSPPTGQSLKQYYGDRLQELQSGTGLSDIAIGLQILTQAERPHADDDFLGTKWWPNEAEKAEILRQTFIKAYQVAIASPQDKPVVLYWVVSGGTFEGVVVDGDQQVSIFVLTPHPPSQTLTGNVDERMWLIATPTRVDQVRNLYANPSSIPVDVVAGGNVKVLHYRAD